MFPGEIDGNADTALAVGAVAGMRFCQRVAGGWKQCSVAGERVDGISAHDAANGEYFTVYTVGAQNRVTSGAAITDGARTATDAAGKAIPATAEHPFEAGKCEMAVAAADLVTVIRLETAQPNIESEPA